MKYLNWMISEVLLMKDCKEGYSAFRLRYLDPNFKARRLFIYPKYV
jgi:hypothetical protein